MNVAEKFGVGLKPLYPPLVETKTFRGGNAVVQEYLQGLAPKHRYRLLNYGIGVEIEVEQCPGGAIKGWVVETDGSLRNDGHEYKTLYGTRIHGAWGSLKALEERFRMDRDDVARFNEFSERCSVHVHLDCRQMTAEQLNSVVLLYALVENPFFNFAGHQRWHGIFSVPMLQSVVGNKDASFLSLLRNNHKYAALNFKTLGQYGTLEFRHMEGTDSADRIFTWIMLIGALRYYAETVPNQKIQEDICKLKYESHYDNFINAVFGRLSQYIKIDQGVLDSAVSDAKLYFYKGSF